MELSIKEITEKKIWDQFFSTSKNSSFLQTWEWGDFENEGLGKEIERIGLYDENEKLISIAQLITEASRFGKYVYIPRGPLGQWDNTNEIKSVLNTIVSYIRSKKSYIALRIDPDISDNDHNNSLVKDLGFTSAANFRQVKRYWILNLDGESEEELLASAKQQGMSSSLPRHIRKAVKNGVSVRVSEELADVGILIDTLKELSERKKIPTRPASYFEEQFSHLAPAGYMKMFIAEFKGKPISSLLVSFCGNEAATLHGATISDVDPNLYVTKRIYWDAILYAKSHGYDRFNFYGVVSDKNMNNPEHPSYGYSVFKRRFGGHVEENIGAWDYIINPAKYRLLWAQEKYRQKRYEID